MGAKKWSISGTCIMHNEWGRWLKHGQWNTVVSKVRFIDGNHITLLSVWIKRNRNQMEDIVDNSEGSEKTIRVTSVTF